MVSIIELDKIAGDYESREMEWAKLIKSAQISSVNRSAELRVAEKAKSKASQIFAVSGRIGSILLATEKNLQGNPKALETERVGLEKFINDPLASTSLSTVTKSGKGPFSRQASIIRFEKNLKKGRYDVAALALESARPGFFMNTFNPAKAKMINRDIDQAKVLIGQHRAASLKHDQLETVIANTNAVLAKSLVKIAGEKGFSLYINELKKIPHSAGTVAVLEEAQRAAASGRWYRGAHKNLLEILKASPGMVDVEDLRNRLADMSDHIDANIVRPAYENSLLAEQRRAASKGFEASLKRDRDVELCKAGVYGRREALSSLIRAGITTGMPQTDLDYLAGRAKVQQSKWQNLNSVSTELGKISAANYDPEFYRNGHTGFGASTITRVMDMDAAISRVSTIAVKSGLRMAFNGTNSGLSALVGYGRRLHAALQGPQSAPTAP